METWDFTIKDLGYDVSYLKRESKEIFFRVNVKTEDFENYSSALVGKLCVSTNRVFQLKHFCNFQNPLNAYCNFELS